MVTMLMVLEWGIEEADFGAFHDVLATYDTVTVGMRGRLVVV